MSDTFENEVLRRLQRVETLAFSHTPSFDHSDDIKALRSEIASLKAELSIKRGEIADLQKQVATKTTKRAVSEYVVGDVVPQMLDVVSSAIVDEQKSLKREISTHIEDSTRAIARDVERAEAAASANIKHAMAVLTRYSEELGA